MKRRRPFSNSPWSISRRTTSSICSMGSWLAATKTASTRPVGVNDANGAHDTGCSSWKKRAHAPGGHPYPLSADPLESDTTCTSSNLEVLTPLPSRLPDGATGVGPRGERCEGERWDELPPPPRPERDPRLFGIALADADARPGRLHFPFTSFPFFPGRTSVRDEPRRPRAPQVDVSDELASESSRLLLALAQQLRWQLWRLNCGAGARA